MRADKRLHVRVPRLKNQSQKRSPKRPAQTRIASLFIIVSGCIVFGFDRSQNETHIATGDGSTRGQQPRCNARIASIWYSIRLFLHAQNTVFLRFKRLFNGSGPFFQPQMKFSGCNFISRASNQRRFRQFLPGSKARRGYCRTQFIRRYLRWRKSREVSL